MFINLRTSLSGFHGNGRRTRRGGKRVLLRAPRRKGASSPVYSKQRSAVLGLYLLPDSAVSSPQWGPAGVGV